ncbi:hypothetical protein BH09PAT3_BH09PAT3_2340 [soil metagenome]
MSELAENVFNADNWAGYDILDPSMFVETTYEPPIYLDKREFNAARNDLLHGLGNVAAGNSTEIKYGLGKEFNSELPDGSLVVVDQETAMVWRYDQPRAHGDAEPEAKGNRITRPYSSHWLQCQYEGIAAKDAGVESLTIAQKNLLYVRTLKWGVLVTQGERRGILEFGFGSVKLLPGGIPDAPKYWRGLMNTADPMPISVGRVEPDSLRLDEVTVDSLSRVRSIDVVYPAANRTSKGRKRRVPKLAKLVPVIRPV